LLATPCVFPPVLPVRGKPQAQFSLPTIFLCLSPARRDVVPGLPTSHPPLPFQVVFPVDKKLSFCFPSLCFSLVFRGVVFFFCRFSLTFFKFTPTLSFFTPGFVWAVLCWGPLTSSSAPLALLFPRVLAICFFFSVAFFCKTVPFALHPP